MRLRRCGNSSILEYAPNMHLGDIQRLRVM
jgi:hypothetical protein